MLNNQDETNLNDLLVEEALKVPGIKSVMFLNEDENQNKIFIIENTPKRLEFRIKISVNVGINVSTIVREYSDLISNTLIKKHKRVKPIVFIGKAF
ncbi:MAG: hypothetical protein K4H23_01580 [Mollicutes bacterium PWAP]|nr:hypothetical protein [Mollicutes bacterium PWAP]